MLLQPTVLALLLFCIPGLAVLIVLCDRNSGYDIEDGLGSAAECPVLDGQVMDVCCLYCPWLMCGDGG